MTRAVRVLVVDDDSLARRKLSLAVRALGHEAEPASSGAEALERLRAPGIDIVLLDIEMPDMNGFDVLQARRAAPAEQRVPVIVVSSLDVPEEIARAIELGAVDFLPKAFNAVILDARINACLRETRRREADLRTLRQIQRLTLAAQELDAEDMNPRELRLDDLAQQEDALGTLSRVLLNKSILVYNRRQAQATQIKTLTGILLLLLIGACFGIRPALASRMLAGDLAPWAASLLTLGLTALLLTGFAVAAGRAHLRGQAGRTVLWLALTGPFLPLLLLMWVAGSVSAVTISIVLALETFLVSLICAGIGVEAVTRRRLAGLLLGLAGVLLVLGPSLSLGSDPVDLAVAFLIPALYALRTVLLRAGAVAAQDPVALAAVFYLVAAGLALALFGAAGLLPALALPGWERSLFLLVFSAAQAVGVIAMIYLVRYTGAVFASQKSFTVALGGVIWSILLLGEAFTLVTGLSLVFLLAGLALVADLAPTAELFAAPRKRRAAGTPERAHAAPQASRPE
jgi:DNA-binding response OmpR family regulator/drug/metabolite transporter (DMT)-like permease